MNVPAQSERGNPVALTAEDARSILAHACELAVDHIESIGTAPVAPAESGAEAIREWLADFDFDSPAPVQDVLSDTTAQLRQWGVHTTHPGYFGLFNPAPTWPGVAGEVLAAAINPQLAAHSHAPAAVEIERHVLRFMAARLGLPDAALGSFTSGGAEANHTAAILALTTRIPGFAENGLVGVAGRPVFYASTESHLVWLKIAHACGLGRGAVRLVPVDRDHRMDIRALEAMYDADCAAGAEPFMIAGTAGTTGAGALDPLPELARRAREWGLHFHVDAAWAGAIALSDQLRPLLDGIELADTVTVDAHKWMSAPMGAGMVLSANPEPVRRAFHVSTAYMPAAAETGDDPYTTSTQWSRRAIGLKVFLSLAVFGHRAYARQLEHDTALGTYIAERAEAKGWTRINTTPLPVICLINPDADTRGADASWEWHAAVAADVVNSGQAWISPVRLAGRPALRICVTNHRSTTDDADRLINTLAHARDRRRSPGAPRSTKRR